MEGKSSDQQLIYYQTGCQEFSRNPERISGKRHSRGRAQFLGDHNMLNPWLCIRNWKEREKKFCIVQEVLVTYKFPSTDLFHQGRGRGHSPWSAIA
jgi:hypothetical protein